MEDDALELRFRLVLRVPHAVRERQHLEEPPELRQTQLILQKAHRVREVLLFLAQARVRFGCGNTVRDLRARHEVQRRGAIQHDGTLRRGVEADAVQEFGVEADAGVGEEALVDQPAQGGAREVVAYGVGHRAATDTCGVERSAYHAPPE